MPHLRLAAAQLNTVVGDLSGNVDRILAALAAAEAAGGGHLRRCPSWPYPGYPPEDLLLKPGFVADNVTALEKVAAATRHCAVVVGFVGAAPGGVGLANAAAVCAGGRVVGVYRKRFLPNYGVFDEQRWFVPSDEPPPLFGVAGRLGRCLHLRGRLVRRRPGRAGRAGRRRCRGRTSTRRPTTGAVGPSASPCCRAGWPRPAAPSPT